MYPSPNPDTFYPLVWKIVKQVPHGVVSTYGQVASMIPAPEGIDPDAHRRLAPKWVGQAMNAVSYSDIDGKPNAPGVPWWRIINSKGGISLPAGSRAAREQAERLKAEGVVFGPDEQVELGRFGWEGPPQDWLDANGLLTPPSLRKPDTPSQPSLF